MAADPAVSAVPQQVSGAQLKRSRSMSRGGDGQIYEYADGAFLPDVYVLQRSGGWDMTDQAKDFLKSLRVARFDGDFDDYGIVSQQDTSFIINQQELHGREIVYHTIRRGLRRDAYFLVIDVADKYVRFRITQPVSPESLAKSRDFARAWLTAYLGGTISTAVEFEGQYAHGFEVASFVPCGSSEKWWTVLPAADGDRYNAMAKPYQPVYLKAVGDTSARGQHGHLGAYARVFNITKVVRMAPLDSLSCN